VLEQPATDIIVGTYPCINIQLLQIFMAPEQVMICFSISFAIAIEKPEMSIDWKETRK